MSLTLAHIQEAAQRIARYVHRTPVLTSQSLNAIVGAQIFFKCENFQKVGAFKFRGACNAVFSLSPDEVQRGVATHSSGNHAAALALAAKLRGTVATIVMPKTAPAIKKAAVASYGGRIIFCEPTLAARESTLAAEVAQSGATVIHPYNDERVIAGQGTAALELLEEVPNLDAVLTPVGGGGLLSGTAIAVTARSPKTKVFGVEPEGADDAYRSFKTGYIQPSLQPKTIADGLLTSLGDKTFPIIQEKVSDIVTVSEEGIVSAMRLIWERMKIIVEPSCAVPFAALLERRLDLSGKRVGIILSGGNVDLDKLPWQHSEPATYGFAVSSVVNR
ncbi:MAG: pyridoxal-phosphate dependent enzyme [Chloroherpetonaceae bacterium]|nr:pyridoxal-phosphate dependent enzyme [Chloroherpetonaceae bacterium]